MNLMTTRPDICCECCKSFYQHQGQLIRMEWCGFSSTLRTLPEKGLYSNCEHTKVIGFSNVDWVRSPNDRQSATGFYMFLGKKSCVIKKQEIECGVTIQCGVRVLCDGECNLKNGLGQRLVNWAWFYSRVFYEVILW